ncbi:MAG: XdhC/CoxI family protein [Synergistaceae bacterium]|nr:XdhC/CoxI family protein [Synergistaceae bacterium]
MQASFIKKIAGDIEAGQRGVFCLLVGRSGTTPRSPGASMWVYPDGDAEGTVGGGSTEYECIKEALDMLEKDDKVRVKSFVHDCGPNSDAECGGDVQVYFELIEPEDEVFVLGAGHVGGAVARFAAICGFRATVWDNLEEYANEENIPWGRTICCPLEELFDESKRGKLFHENCYVVIATRGHAMDSDAMRLLAGKKTAYIGVMGSRSKIASVNKLLIEAGVSEDYLNSVKRPIGLPLKGETPEDVALSIISEIVAARNGANLEALRNAR